MDSNFKTYITGASGLLGRALLKEFKSQNIPCLGLSFSRPIENGLQVDLRDFAKVAEVFKEIPPAAIVHSAAHRKPDLCENDPAETQSFNVLVVENLAKIAKSLNIPFIYISTDYVFDGTKSPYNPEDQPNPLNAYGHSKLAGEKACLSVYPNSKILRVPVLYGEIEFLGECALSGIFNSALKNPTASFDDLCVRFPTHTEDVAKAVVYLIKNAADLERNIEGKVFHFSAKEAWTKFEIARLVLESQGLDSSKLVADKTQNQTAPRPINCQLSTSFFDEVGIVCQKDFKTEFLQLCQALI